MSNGWPCFYNRNELLTALDHPTSVHNSKSEYIFVEKDNGPWGIPACNDASNFPSNYIVPTNEEKRVLRYFGYEVEANMMHPKKKFRSLGGSKTKSSYCRQHQVDIDTGY